MAHHTSETVADRFPITNSALSHREELVTHAMSLLLDKRVIIVHAPPMSGKTTLCKLLARKILVDYPDLEPVQIMWPARDAAQIRAFPYNKLLEEERQTQVAFNSEARAKFSEQPTAHGSKPKHVYLIDEAENTYMDHNMWDNLFKCHPEDVGPDYYVLFLVHGSAEGGHKWGYDPWQSNHIAIDRRIELFPTSAVRSCMLLDPKEIKMVVDRSFATFEDGGAKCDDNVYEFMETETQGHTGALNLFLTHIMLAVRSQDTATERGKTYFDVERCHKLLGDGVVSTATEHGRGFWSLRVRQAVANFGLPNLRQTKKYSSLTVQDLEDGMLAVAESPDGYQIHSSNPDSEPMKMKLEACHILGIIYVGPAEYDAYYEADKVVYRFASRFHQRVALASIFPRPVPTGSLYQECVKALRKYRPSALAPRRDPPIPGAIPAAAFHSEMYACLKHGLKGHQIYAEFAGDHTGWVDFYVPRPKCWGIELLQNGTPVQIEEHGHRFGLCGKYSRWSLMDDYIILNFCVEDKHLDLRGTGSGAITTASAKIFQVVYDEQRKSMEVYNAEYQRVEGPFFLNDHGLDHAEKGDYPT